jgi:membrane protein implicated in regulation of membrane protease activity
MWSAELAEPGEPLPVGTRVTVTVVEGLRLKVKKSD